MDTCSVHVVLTFESVDKILWCDKSNETFFGSTFAWYHLFFNIKFLQIKFGIFLEF